MTTHIVADDTLGTISRRMWEVQRRLMEGTLEPSFVARNLQSIVEEKEVTSAPLVTASPFFANEEVKSNYGYPQGYAVKPVCEQLVELSKHFNGLNTSSVLACSKELPALPAGAEGWFAVPRWEKVASSYNEAVEKVLDLIGKTRTFHNYRKGALGPKYLRLSERTAVALQMIGEKQKGDFLLIPAQFGLTHRGRSVRRMRVVYAPHEFGLGSFIVDCMLLSHPERLIQWEQLHIDCPGDEYSPGADGRFGSAPYFLFDDVRVKFNAYGVSDPDDSFGSASGFLSQ
ncbi:MAG: hypothetical protein HYW77_01070 [Parcubacteria group bacterium]|nr:hypothetical protein [Parcubacteria group bacterium]